MEKYIEKSMKLEKISEEIFRKLEINFIPNKPQDNICDFCVEINNSRYAVDVKNKASSFYLSHIANRMKKYNKYKNILIVYDYITDNVRKIIEDTDIILLDISNIIYIVYKDSELLKKISEILDFSLDSIVPKENKLRLQIKENFEYISHEEELLEKNRGYKQRLKNLKRGRGHYKEYEQLMSEILKEILSTNLEFKNQNSTQNRLNIFDMIGKIKKGNEDEFFRTVEDFFYSKYIVFEFKNYSEKITQEQVCTTEKYLYKTALRNVGIIITRNGIDRNGRRVAEGILRESGKLILVLDDSDIERMISLYDEKENPTNVLMEKLDEVLTKLER